MRRVEKAEQRERSTDEPQDYARRPERNPLANRVLPRARERSIFARGTDTGQMRWMTKLGERPARRFPDRRVFVGQGSFEGRALVALQLAEGARAAFAPGPTSTSSPSATTSGSKCFVSNGVSEDEHDDCLLADMAVSVAKAQSWTKQCRVGRRAAALTSGKRLPRREARRTLLRRSGARRLDRLKPNASCAVVWDRACPRSGDICSPRDRIQVTATRG